MEACKCEVPSDSETIQIGSFVVSVPIFVFYRTRSRPKKEKTF